MLLQQQKNLHPVLPTFYAWLAWPNPRVSNLLPCAPSVGTTPTTPPASKATTLSPIVFLERSIRTRPAYVLGGRGSDSQRSPTSNWRSSLDDELKVEEGLQAF